MSFDSVPAALRDALSRRGFTQLTSVQTAVLAADDGARDLQITSQTGSGKTVALGFVLAAGLQSTPPSPLGPTTLIIAPTRELAVQVRDELTWLFADLLATRVDSVTGGTHVGGEQKRLTRCPRVLVGTPGRLLDHVRSGALNLSAVTQVVLDEADQMLDLGFRDDLLEILAAMPEQRRTHLVSATFPPEVRELTRKYQSDPLHIEGTALGAANVDIEHIVHSIDPKQRYAALVNLLLLSGDERTLVFVRTRAETAELADKLTADGFAAQPISGELSQVLRTRTLAAFKRGLVTALIATDVAARGLDIADVTTVIHYDPPTDGAVYTHRSGRTGRAGQKGRSVMLTHKGIERRVRRILNEARVTASWKPAPDSETVRAAQSVRTEAALREALAKHTPSAEQNALAARLLGEYPPAELVAGLLCSLASHQPRAPFEVKADAGARERRMREPSEPGAVERTQPSSEPPTRERAIREESRQGDAPSIRFKINWGESNGADPKRILAHVCRRGGISSRDVGAIEIRRLNSCFDVAAAVADEFAARVEARDSRDPHLVIVPFPRRGTTLREPAAREEVPERRPESTRPKTIRPIKTRFAKTKFSDRFGKGHKASAFDWS